MIHLRQRSSILILAAATAVLSFGVACSDSPTGPSQYAPFNQMDLRAGTGTEATAGKVLTVNYTGWLYKTDATEQKGAQFDSSIGATPFVFILGAGGVIDGWDQGLVGMKVGGLRRLVIPPSLGYGRIRNSSIPPNATLVFEIELLDVQ